MADQPIQNINVSNSPLSPPPGVIAGTRAIARAAGGLPARHPGDPTAIRSMVEDFTEATLDTPNFGQSEDPTQMYEVAVSAGLKIFDIYSRTRMESYAQCIRQARYMARQIPSMRRNRQLSQHPVMQVSPGQAFYWFKNVLAKSLEGESLKEATMLGTGMLMDAWSQKAPEGRTLANWKRGQQ